MRSRLLLITLLAIAAPALADEDDLLPGWHPVGVGEDGSTWVQLDSGEWLKGEFKEVRDEHVTFDSDELGELDYDWDDIRSVVCSVPHTVTTWDREVYTGLIVARDGMVRVVDADGNDLAVLDPENVSSLIEGLPHELNFWVGKVSLGATVRTGNSDQSDASFIASVDRRALHTRWQNEANVSLANAEGRKTQESHRYASRYEWFLSRRLFVRVAEYEYYRDPFQNVSQRHTTDAGFGYDRVDGPFEWDVTLGTGYQFLEYSSVTVDQQKVEEYWIGRVATNLTWDVASDVDFDLGYSMTFPVQEADRYSHNLLAQLSFDLWWDFSFDLTLAWDRQNRPQQDEDGNTPKKDDLRMSAGLGWEF